MQAEGAVAVVITGCDVIQPIRTQHYHQLPTYQYRICFSFKPLPAVLTDVRLKISILAIHPALNMLITCQISISRLSTSLYGNVLCEFSISYFKQLQPF